MKILPSAFFALLLASGVAHSQVQTAPQSPPPTPKGTGTNIPPFHVTLDGMEIRIHQGANTTVVNGPNNVDTPKTLTCISANGCVISIQSEVYVCCTTRAYDFYALVDGVEANPQWPTQAQDGFFGVNQQSVHVAVGTHTVQSVFVDYGVTGTLYGWQINYTLYER